MNVNPSEVFEQYRIHGEEWVNLDAAASLLEETRKSVRAQIMTAFGDMPVSRAEMMAESDPAYKEHLEKMIEARKQANLARVTFDAYKAWIDLTRSVESTKREEMRRLG